MLNTLRILYQSILEPRQKTMRVQARCVGHMDINPEEYWTIKDSKLVGVDYSGRELEQFCSVGSRFDKCRFDGMRVDDCSFGAGKDLSEYIDCSFDQLRFRHSIGNVARFIRCTFRDVNLQKWTCFRAEFIDCVFSGKLQTCIFNGRPLDEDVAWLGRQRNEFHGNDFSGAELRDVAFRTGIDLNQQTLPTGPDYLYVPDAAAAIERAHRGLANWKPDTELNRLANVIVTVKANLVADGQEQFLMNLAEYYKGRRKFPREVVDKVVSLLRGDSA